MHVGTDADAVDGFVPNPQPKLLQGVADFSDCKHGYPVDVACPVNRLGIPV